MTPNHPTRARSLAARVHVGSLATIGWEGHPHGSLVQFVTSDDGAPVLLLSKLAAHTKNLDADSRASLLIVDDAAGDPLTRSRVTLLGTVATSDAPGDRDAYLSRHPAAAAYIDFGDFDLYRLHVARARYIQGFGEMSWVDGSAWLAARPDPLVGDRAGIIAHMNDDHADALLLYTHVLSACPNATRVVMVGIDELGFDLRVLAPTEHPHRIDFETPVRDRNAARSALVALVKKARAMQSEN